MKEHHFCFKLVGYTLKYHRTSTNRDPCAKDPRTFSKNAKMTLTLPSLEEQRHPQSRMHLIGTPSPELQRGTFPSHSEFMDSVTRI